MNRFCSKSNPAHPQYSCLTWYHLIGFRVYLYDRFVQTVSLLAGGWVHISHKIALFLRNANSQVNLNIDGEPITSRTHTRPSHSQTSRLLTSSLSEALGVPVPRATQCIRGVQIPQLLVFSLSSHRHSYIGFVCSSRFIDS